jgi:class 3 adenylate cyclase
MKFSKKAFPPGFFDLSQDISRDLPVDVIAQWTATDQSAEAAQNILNKTKVTGTIVSSDSAGLSKMSQNLGLIEVLAKINRPKELVYSYGSGIGGEGVGIWAADNTQMFYRENVPLEHIATMVTAMQDHVQKECEVKIGLGVHYGEFYSLGGGLYGPHADWIEDVAENHTSGGEVVITEHFFRKLPAHHLFRVTQRDDVSFEQGAIYRLDNFTRGSQLYYELPLGNEQYPIPYSENFYKDLKHYQQTNDSKYLKEMYRKYGKDLAVVLIEREREEVPVREINLLNDLALSVVMKKNAQELLDNKNGWEVKTAGNLGIYLFNDCQHALEYAKKFREELLKDGIKCRIGIDCGTVLEFNLDEGHKDIAGMPVNRASKMAQDKGEMGNIYLSDTVAAEVDTTGFKPITFQVSGVSIQGLVG